MLFDYVSAEIRVFLGHFEIGILGMELPWKVICQEAMKQ